MRKGSVLTMMLIAVGIGAVAPALAQQSSDVRFQPGTYGAAISGTITGNEYFDYRLAAKAGQKLSVAWRVDGTNGDGSVFLNILPPGSDNVAIYNGSTDADRAATVQLPAAGTYTIRVYLMGNDRDAAKTVGYIVDVSIQ